jgi:uncharacterized protein involved in exopolysaccharide biosynthesis
MFESRSPFPRNLADVGRAVFRHRRKALAAFLIVTGAATLTAFLLPKTYRSEGKFFVRLGRENAILDTAATLGAEPAVAVPQSRENEINSLVELLGSRAIVEKVADALGPDALFGSAAPSALDRERAILQLRARIAVTPARKSNIIGITCEGPSPEWAQKVLAQLMDVYQVEHIRLNRPYGSLDFFTEQAARLGRELARKEKDLGDLKSVTGISSVTDQQKSLAERISRLQDELGRAETGRAVCEVETRQLRGQLTGIPERLAASETAGFANDGTDRMREQLYALQVRREEAVAKYTPLHPVMQEIEQEFAAARRVVDGQEKTRTQITMTPNHLHVETQAAILRKDAEMAAFRAKTTALKDEVARTHRELQVFNEDQRRIAEAERDLELNRANYRACAASLERAKIEQALESQRISNISVAQEASYEPKAIRPRKMLLLPCGLMAGLMSALGAALVAEWAGCRSSVREAAESRLVVPPADGYLRQRNNSPIPNGNGSHTSV